MATQISSNGVTFYFDGDYLAGHYVNGEPWWDYNAIVVNIEPAGINDGVRVINGAQVNPINSISQGYDSANSDMTYVDSINVDPTYTGLVISGGVGDRIFKSVSLDTINAQGRPLLDKMVIGTLIDPNNPPSIGDFRPPYSGHNPSLVVNESDIDWSSVPNFSSLPSTPNPSTLNLGTVIDYNTQFTQRAIQPASQQPFYGGNLAKHVGDIMCVLASDYTQAEKRDLMISILQYGIDLYGIMHSPGIGGDSGQFDYFYNNGGHNIGRYTPLKLAQHLLPTVDLSIPVLPDAYPDVGADPFGAGFQECQNTFIIGAQHVAPNGPYDPLMLGEPEWIVRIDQGNYNPDWATNYRDINGRAMVSHVLASNLFGIALDEPLTNYAERYFEYEQDNGFPSVNKMSIFVIDMFNNFYDRSTPNEPNMMIASGQVIWSGGDAGEDETIPQSDVIGDLGSIFNISADGIWSIEVDGNHPALQTLNIGESYTIEFTVVNSDGVTTTAVSLVVNGQDDIPYVDPASTTIVTLDEI